MEIADVEAALAKVRQFIALLEENESIWRTWNAAAATSDSPPLNQSDRQVLEQLPLILRIAERADIQLAAKLKEDGYGWSFRPAMDAS